MVGTSPEVVVLPSVGHKPEREAPQAVAAAMRAFIEPAPHP